MTAPTTGYGAAEARVYDSKRFTTRSGREIHRTEFAMLERALRFTPRDSRILDVGCGTGRLLLEALEAGFTVDGIDASTHMLARCKEKIKDRFPESQLMVGEAGRLPYRSNSYDLVYCARLLNQVGSKAYALDSINEIIRVARPNAYVLIEFMNHHRPRFAIRNNQGVRLRPKEVAERAAGCGAALVWCRGAFFWGMTSLHLVPDFLVTSTSAVDRAFSRMFPRLCSRCYMLFQKGVQA